MTSKDRNPYDALERIFHEPNRLAIMSALCAAESGLSFTELRTACDLTDGNLSRHLKSLEDAGAVDVQKTFVDAKPRTTVTISKTGLLRFTQYLDALGSALKKAKKSLPDEKSGRSTVPLGKTVKA